MRYISGRNYKSPKRKGRSPWRKQKTRRVTHPSAQLFGAQRSSVRLPTIRITAIPWRQVFLATAVISWFLLMVYLPYFQVTSISINGTQLLKKDEIHTALQSTFLDGGKLWPKSNYFLLSATKMQDFLKNKYSLTSAEIKKVFPNTLEVVIEEKVTAIIYDTGTEYYLVGQKGDMIRSLTTVASNEFVPASKAPFLHNFDPIATATSSTSTTSTDQMGMQTDIPVHVPNYLTLRRNYGLYPVVYQIPDTATTSSVTTVRSDVVNGIIELYSALEKTKLAIPNYVVMGDPAGGAALISNQGWKLYFMPDGNIADQLANAKIILQTNKPTDYVDVRYGDHVYWK